jgi:branched-chain amino acid transport system ATP-binding protein
MLSVRALSCGYGQLQIVYDVDLEVAEGEWVALLGPAGAGKTTLLRSVAGLIPPLSGSVAFRGEDVRRVPAFGRVRLGLSLVHEGRRLFRGMTVLENLVAGAFVVRDQKAIAERLAWTFDLFPVLAERRKQVVGTLSGGEQQMCAIGRSLMARPALLVVDELSLGLAPVVVADLLEALVEIRRQGTTLLVVEQDVRTALRHADRGYVMRQGRIVKEGPSDELLRDADFQREFLGV